MLLLLISKLYTRNNYRDLSILTGTFRLVVGKIQYV